MFDYVLNSYKMPPLPTPWELLWETHPLPHIVIYHPLRSKWEFKYTQCKDKHQLEACIWYIHQTRKQKQTKKTLLSTYSARNQEAGGMEMIQLPAPMKHIT